MATKLDKMVTYLDRSLSIKSHGSKVHALAGSCDKIKSFYLREHNTMVT